MLKFLFIILNSLIISGTVNFSVDMSNIDFPNDSYQSAVVNGSWNSWSGWGVILNDDNEDGIYEGVLEVENGTYEYVIALTGTEDNWSGWGQTINAPIGSSCDWNPNDQWANYGFNINDNDIYQSYCAGNCNPYCLENNSDGIEQLTPPDNSFMRTIHVPFEWKQEPDAISYNLQIANTFSNDMFENSTILDTIINDIVYIDTYNINWSNNYWWRVKPIYDNANLSEWSNTFTFEVGNKKFPERNANIYNEDILQDGLIAFGGFGGTEETDLASCVIDKFGNEIWNDGNLSFILNHINEYGNLYGMSNVNWPQHTGSKISWNHNYDISFLWSAPMFDNIGVDIHEIKQIYNGNYMAFVPDYSRLGPIPDGDWAGLFQSQGYQVDGITDEYPYIAMRIVEWDEDGNEIWNWDPYDHFTTEHTDLYGGSWWAAFNDGIFDWMHSNAFHFDEEESVIYVSHRHLSRISKISYPSGEVIWNMGMPPGYGTGDDNICTDLGFSYQHNIQLMDDGSLMFFDNGNVSQLLLGDDNPTSRVRRIRVIDDSYCTTEWEYELPPNLFGAGMGSVQLLENGNYLIYTFGNGLNLREPTLMEITSNQELLWSYQGIPTAFWYRTYKIPSLHPEFFSVRANNYTTLDNQNIVEISNSLDFSITNHSGYNNVYKYIFSDSTDEEESIFNNQEGEISIGPYETINLSFTPQETNFTSSQVQLNIWPKYHLNALKELSYTVSIVDNTNTADINGDGIINVIDIVSLVNLILNPTNSDLGDINNDGFVNVVDVVSLVNQILQD